MNNEDWVRKKLRITGVVQGVGFRPFLWHQATRIGLTGWVINDTAGVALEVQGTNAQLEELLDAFEERVPPMAIIRSIDSYEIPVKSESGFTILGSSSNLNESTPIAADITVCSDCLQEFNDPKDRRYRYPFTNCTNCGPRFTIVEDIPYDRSRTTMKSFPMCADCRQEFDQPDNRRFHAQSNACPACGPRIWLVTDKSDERQFLKSSVADNEAAIQDFNTAIKRGDIVAVKGIGGFHLACDGTCDQTIKMLRERKGRIERPFAVMIREPEQAKAFAVLSDREMKLLTGPDRPIVLLEKKVGQSLLSDYVAPDINLIGVMLPYSPLHYLLIGDTPLVMTSANLTNEPIVRTNLEASNRLANLADAFLLHDREIHFQCDDSVIRNVDNQMIPMRRSRGHAPLPINLSETGPSVLAIGGDLKSTFCVTRNDRAYVSQHIGDLENIETLQALKRNIDHLIRLYRINVKAVAADLHPDYMSVRFAKQLASSLGIPLFGVQHHQAHIVSLLTEHSLPITRQVIGCCLDGTGYGTDRNIWGGEFFVGHRERLIRFAHLKYTPLPGGDSSIRRPYRAALALLWSYGFDWDRQLPCEKACTPEEQNLLRQQLEKNLNCVLSSSMGRLFDAIASLLGVRQTVTYEAQAAIELESLAVQIAHDVDPHAYTFCLKRAASDDPMSPAEIDCGSLIGQILTDIRFGVETNVIAAQFHHAVANLVLHSCKTARDVDGINTVGLTGGVFQNALLFQLTTRRLAEDGFEVLTHSNVPPNDGGLALGQAVVARQLL